MRPIKTMLFIVMALSLAYSSFSAMDYLLPGEKRSSVTYENFTFEGSDFELIRINGTASFLVKDGDVLNESEDISYVIYSYYKQSSYPSDEEMEELYQLMHEYNQSRNNGEFRKGEEEYLCRDILFISGKVDIAGEPVVCVDDESCQKAAALVYSAYRKGVGFSGMDEVFEMVQAFSYASDGLDESTDEALDKLDELNEDNIHSHLYDVSELIDDIEQHEATIEASRFRVPNTKDEDYYRAYGLCPPLEFNETILAELEGKIDNILSEVQPFSDYENVSASIYNQTHYRVTQRYLETEAEYYAEFFEPIHEEGEEVINESEEILSAITNTSLRMKVDELEDLDEKINNSIETLDLDTIEEDLDRYEFLVDNITDSLPSVEAIYDESMGAKYDARAYVFILESKNLDENSATRIVEIKEDLDTLDARFSGKKLSDEQFANLTVAYKELASEARSILKEQKEGFPGIAMTKFRSFARRVNNGFADFVEFTEVMEPSEVPENKMTSFGGFSLAAFLSLSAIVVLVFLIILSNMAVIKPTTVIIPAIGLIVAIIAILAFSVFLYMNLDNTANNADIEEFVIDMSNQERAVVVLDLDSIPASAEGSMKTCAGLLAESMKENDPNMTVQQYYFHEGACIVYTEEGPEESRSEEYCYEKMNEGSAFLLNYSSVDTEPHYNAIYERKAYLSGDEEYYSECMIANIFR